jgi:hypothetical protein
MESAAGLNGDCLSRPARVARRFLPEPELISHIFGNVGCIMAREILAKRVADDAAG